MELGVGLGGGELLTQAAQAVGENALVHVREQLLVLKEHLQQAQFVDHHELGDAVYCAQVQAGLVVVSLGDLSFDRLDA